MTVSAARRGAALFLTLVVLAVVTLIAAEAMHSMVAAQRQSKRATDELQAQWLAEAALGRALVQTGRQPEYKGETWRPQIGGRTGVAEIRLESASGPPKRIIAEVRFPDDPVRRIAV